MATGLKIYDASGRVVLDMTASVSQMVGYVDTNKANGSRVIPAAPTGKTLFYAVASLEAQTTTYLGKQPGVTLNGTTLSWQYQYQSGWGYYSMNCRIHYGYF